MGIVSITGNLKILQVKVSAFVETFGLAGLLSIGLFFRLWQINGALWYDEAFSAWLARLPLESLIRATLYDVHPPPYYLLLRVISGFWGVSEAILRLPSVIAGLLLIYLVYRLARSLDLSQPAVWLATSLTTIAPFQIYYSQEARFYTMQMACVCLAAIGLVERRWWLLVAGSLGALYLHNVSVIYIASLFLIELFLDTRRTKMIFVAGGIVAVGFLPGGIFAVHQTQAITGNYWIPALSSPPGRILAALDDLIFLMPGNVFVVSSGLATCLGVVLILANVGHDRRGPKAFLLLVTVLPLFIAVLVSLLWQPIIISRVLAPIAPFYYLLLAWSVTQSRRRMIVWSAVTLPALAIILTGYLLNKFGHLPIDADYLNLYGQYQPGDAIYHASPGSYVTFRYYRPDIPQFLMPQGGDLAQGLTQKTRSAMGMAEVEFDLIKCSNNVTDQSHINRWWLVQFNNPLSTSDEIGRIENIVNHYNARKIAMLRQDVTVDAWLYLIKPKCDEPRGK